MKRLVAFILLVSLTNSGRAQTNPSWAQKLHAKLDRMADHLQATLKPWPVPDKVYRVEDFGGMADGRTVNSAAINRAIAACAAKGGGVVLFSKGDYVSGTIDLKSGVMLEVAAGARILGSTNLVDFPDRLAKRRTVMDSNMDVRQSLIFAEGCDRIGIRGQGVIDGRGTTNNFPGVATIGKTPGRPFLLRFIDSRNIVMQGITLRDSPCWMENYLHCENLILHGITVDNQANWNNDGADIDGCRNVIVRNCLINSEDDGLCFKGASLKAMENVLVENSKFYSTCNAIKFGTDSQGDFRNILIRDVETGGPPMDMRAITRRRAISGISWESVDGATVENIIATNIHIVRVDAPIFLRLGDRGRVMPGMRHPAPGAIRRIVFENITGDDNGALGSIISGIPAACISDVLVRNMNIETEGGAPAAPTGKAIGEKADAYPEAFMFGRLAPAYGFWVRHARNVQFWNVNIAPAKPDARPCYLSGGDVMGMAVNGKPF